VALSFAKLGLEGWHLVHNPRENGRLEAVTSGASGFFRVLLFTAFLFSCIVRQLSGSCWCF